MARIELHASWMDGEAFRALWAPLDAADEFLLISCYVSGPAWEELEKTLRTHLKRPTFRCTLLFSLAGIAATSRRELIDRLFLLVTEQRTPDRVQVFLINDQGSALFHPKAHGSSSGQRTKVVIGSANLTMAARQSNYELMAVVEGVPEAYQELRRSIDALVSANPVKVDRTTIDALRNSTAVDALMESVNPRQSRDGTKRPTVLELPKRDYSTLLPLSSESNDAWLKVRALFGKGGYVARIDQLDPLVVSIPLTTFREAGLLAAPRVQEIGTGVSYENSGGSISVSLIPNELRKKLTQLTKPLGRLLGRFSLECLGGRWMPLAWDERFRQNWDTIASSAMLKQAEQEVAAHVKQLARDLGRSGKLRKRLAAQLEVQKPMHWDEPKVRRMLDWRHDRPRPEKLTEKLKQEVVEVMLQHVTATVERRLSPDFAVAQLRQVGRPPLLRQVALETITVVDALFILSDWTMAGVLSRLRSSSGELTKSPGRSGVSQVLAESFNHEKASAQTVFEAALRWQNAAIEESVEEKDLLRILATAWSNFVLWFGLTPERTDWAQRIPTWSISSAGEDDHLLGLAAPRKPRPQDLLQ